MNKKADAEISLKFLVALVLSIIVIVFLFTKAAAFVSTLFYNQKGECDETKVFVDNLVKSAGQILSGEKERDIEYLNIQKGCIVYSLNSDNLDNVQHRPQKCYSKTCICACKEKDCEHDFYCSVLDNLDFINDNEGRPILFKGSFTLLNPKNEELFYNGIKKVYIYKSGENIIISDETDYSEAEYVPEEEVEDMEEPLISTIGLEWDLPFDYEYVGYEIRFLGDVEYRGDEFNHPYFDGYEPFMYLHRYMSIHRGVDIFAPVDMKVKSIADGVLEKVGDCTYVLHQGVGDFDEEQYTSIYCHVDGDENLIGQKVKKGDVIGTIRNLGESSHLHLEMYSKWVSVAAASSKYSTCSCSNDIECDERLVVSDNDACKILDNDQYLIDGGKFFGLY